MDVFMPVDLGWWKKVSQTWDPAWKGPVFDVLALMWAEGFQTADDDRALAQAAGLSMARWKAVRKAVGAFFTVQAGRITQEALEAVYREKLGRSARFRERNSGNIKKRWEKERLKRLQDTNGNTTGNTNGIASGNPNGTTNGFTKTVPLVGDRASSSLDLQINEEEREDLRATRVPVPPHDPRVLQALESYPRFRETDAGVRTPVHIGTNAHQEIADFLTDNPDYPLVFVVRWYAKSEKFPKNLRNFLADPPAREMWESAWARMRREGVAVLRGIVEDIQAHAVKEPA